MRSERRGVGADEGEGRINSRETSGEKRLWLGRLNPKWKMGLEHRQAVLWGTVSALMLERSNA